VSIAGTIVRLTEKGLVGGGVKYEISGGPSHRDGRENPGPKRNKKKMEKHKKLGIKGTKAFKRRILRRGATGATNSWRPQ